MKRKSKDFNEKRISVMERFYPAFFSCVAVLLYLCIRPSFQDSFSELLSACLSFVSIMLGFIGVLIALLFSLNSNMIKDYVLNDGTLKKRIYRFFISPIYSGFAFILISMLFYIKNTIYSIGLSERVIEGIWLIIKLAWIYFLIYFIASSHRIVYIVLHISFYNKSDDELDGQEKEGFDPKNDEEYKRMQEEYVITKEEDQKQGSEDSTP